MSCEHVRIEDVIYVCANCGVNAGCLICHEEWHDIDKCYRTGRKRRPEDSEGRKEARPYAGGREFTLPMPGVQHPVVEKMHTPKRVDPPINAPAINGPMTDAENRLKDLHTELVTKAKLEWIGIDTEADGFPEPKAHMKDGGVYERLAVMRFFSRTDGSRPNDVGVVT